MGGASAFKMGSRLVEGDSGLLGCGLNELAPGNFTFQGFPVS